MTRRAPRNTLTRERVLTGALEIADVRGLEALTIRGLAEHLGVRPMSIYHYVATKDDLLDALVDAVFEELYLPSASGEWRDELTRRAASVREMLSRHPWALAVLESRPQPGPASLAGHEAVLDILHEAGFSVEASGHAFAVLDAFVFGFALQDLMLRSAGLADSAADVRAGMNLRRHPRLDEIAQHYAQAADYPLDRSFEIGLRIALDGIESLREARIVPE